MTTPKATSKAAFYVSGHLGNIGRAVIISGVDFVRPNAWVSAAEAREDFFEKSKSPGKNQG
jgi:hypothetical protein